MGSAPSCRSRSAPEAGQGTLFYEAGLAGGGLTLEASDKQISRRHGTKNGRFRLRVSWLGCPDREIALWVRSCDAGSSADPAHERSTAAPVGSLATSPPPIPGWPGNGGTERLMLA